MTENMKIWDVLAETDKNHTKPFKRSGGFSGTAIKPMYAIQKMTEMFGPCGTGWGYTKPEYTTMPGNDGQVLVFCTIGLWYGSKDKGEQYGPVYGVGGDFVIVKQSSGLRSDDEAFKKAFTDALMNAMKHIGMSADVHMGQFDGSKYDTAPVEAAKPLSKEAVQMLINDINASQSEEDVAKFYGIAAKKADDLDDPVLKAEFKKNAIARKAALKQMDGDK